MNKINTFDYLRNNSLVHVKVGSAFKQNLKTRILNKYVTLTRYSQEIGINRQTLSHIFNYSKFLKFDKLLRIAKEFDISDEKIYSEIISLYARGSHTSKELILSKELVIDEFFVEGYALYLAEGDNGSNGKTIPRKFRFTNSNINVINHMIKWITTYFPNNKFYINLVNPKGNQIDFENAKKLINYDNIKLKEESYHKIVKYRICFDSALLIDLILTIENTIKEICAKDPKLAAAYIRGMMIGEGTAYFNKSRYVRIEMRNEKEIKYLHSLLTMLGFNCKPVLRQEREGHWSIYIRASQLAKFAKEIGFGVHQERQQILEQGVNKVLRVNQYH